MKQCEVKGKGREEIEARVAKEKKRKKKKAQKRRKKAMKIVLVSQFDDRWDISK